MIMNNMEIKRVTHEDADILQSAKAFMLSIITDDFGYEFNPSWHADIVSLEHTYVHDSRAGLFVALSDGEIIGTIAMRPYDKTYPELRSMYNALTTVGVWRHYIKKDRRNQGIGSKLLELAEGFASSAGYSSIYLHTQKTIPGSLEYWLAKGYVPVWEPMDELRTVHLSKSI